ncbi:MAG: UrcA family protein [Pseudomonadota bacterium]
MSTTIRKGRVIVAATLATVGLLGAGSAAANEDLTIRYKSYMLESHAAAVDLYGSIKSRVENYCESSGVRSLNDQRVEAVCVATMLDRTVATIDNDRLTAIHSGTVQTARVAP